MKSDKAIDLNALWSADGGPLTSVSARGLDGHLQVQVGFAAVLLLRRRPDADRADAHLVEAQTEQAALLHRHQPGRHRALQGLDLHRRRTSSTWPTRSYWQSKPGHVGPGGGGGRLPVVPEQHLGQPRPLQGQAQWGGQYVPNIQSFYINKDKSANHYWFPPVLNVSLVPNLTNPLLKQLAVRKAISLAIDRTNVSSRGESGYQAPANQTGVILPTYSGWFDKSLSQPNYNPSKADQGSRGRGLQEGLQRDLQEQERPTALVHDQDDQWLLGLGRVAAADHAPAQAGRDLGHGSG